MLQKIQSALVVGLLALVLGCQTGQENPSTSKLRVAVTVIPQAWLVRQVGGPHVDVITLVQPGASHEAYQPSDVQISQLMQAKAFFRIGVSSEHGPWFAAIRKSGKLKIVDLRRDVPLLEMTEHDHHHGDEAEAEHEPDASEAAYEGKDPHVWLSPQRLKLEARTVADTLAELDPAHKDDYQRNLKDLETRLDQTDATIRKSLEPARGKALFVYHPAWGYFAHDYGLRQIALEQEGKEPSDEELTRLQQQARQEGVKVIFVQPQIASQSANAMAKAIGGRVEVIDPLAEDIPANLVHAAEVIAAAEK